MQPARPRRRPAFGGTRRASDRRWLAARGRRVDACRFRIRSSPGVPGCGVPMAARSSRLWDLRRRTISARRWRQSHRTTTAGAGSPASPPAPCTRTLSDRGLMGLCWAGSVRARSRSARPNNCDRPRALPRRRLRSLAARATLSAALEAYLGRRSAARVLAAPLRRGVGETIQAALLYADLRGFTALIREPSSRHGHHRARCLVRPCRRRGSCLRRRSAEIYRRRRAWRSSRSSETHRAALAMRRCERCPPLGLEWRTG